MTGATIKEVYGEDGQFSIVNGAVGVYPSNVIISTSGNTFRNNGNSGFPYARCALGVNPRGAGTYMARLWLAGPQTTFWFQQRIYVTNPNALNDGCVGFVGPSLEYRLGLATRGSSPMRLAIVDNSGTVTYLSSCNSMFSNIPTSPELLTWQVTLGVLGSINVYLNKVLLTSWTGDTTSYGLTQLYGSLHSAPSTGDAGGYTFHSECLLGTGDLRDCGVVANAPNAAGTRDDWAGSVSDVDGIPVDDSVYNTTTTSGAIQRYKFPSIPTGNYVIIGKATSIRCTQGGGALGTFRPSFSGIFPQCVSSHLQLYHR
jgi:hypothetical protein